jgi:protein-tyrosine phosphatase
MKNNVYSIEGAQPGRLAILPRPRGGDWLEDEVQSWKAAGIDIVVSALTSEEAVEWELSRESELCRLSGLEFVAFPIPDRGVPESVSGTAELANRLAIAVKEGKGVGVHCRAGIGRSSLIAVSVLLALGLDFESAWRRAAAARGCPVPDTDEQREWVKKLLRKAAITPEESLMRMEEFPQRKDRFIESVQRPKN